MKRASTSFGSVRQMSPDARRAISKNGGRTGQQNRNGNGNAGGLSKKKLLVGGACAAGALAIHCQAGPTLATISEYLPFSSMRSTGPRVFDIPGFGRYDGVANADLYRKLASLDVNTLSEGDKEVLFERLRGVNGELMNSIDLLDAKARGADDGGVIIMSEDGVIGYGGRDWGLTSTVNRKLREYGFSPFSNTPEPSGIRNMSPADDSSLHGKKPPTAGANAVGTRHSAVEMLRRIKRTHDQLACFSGDNIVQATDVDEQTGEELGDSYANRDLSQMLKGVREAISTKHKLYHRFTKLEALFAQVEGGWHYRSLAEPLRSCVTGA